MQAYLNDPKLKTKMVRAMAAHVRADRLIHGSYGDGTAAMKDFRGCAVGCSLRTLNGERPVRDHARFPAELGIPLELAYVLDYFFESLPVARARQWPGEFLRAIPVGADLAGVAPALLHWSILDGKYGWMVHARTDEWYVAAADECLRLIRATGNQGDDGVIHAVGAEPHEGEPNADSTRDETEARIEAWREEKYRR